MAKKKNRGKRPPWTPFEERDADHSRRLYEGKLGKAEANRLKYLIPDRVFENSRYMVFWYDVPAVPSPTRPDAEHWPAMIHLSIKEHDRGTRHDWRDFQRIKNEIVGPEHEALELYPAESRLVDTANQFHIFVLANPEIVLPFGMQDGRAVVDSDGELDWQGSRQRKLENPPPDAMTSEHIDQIVHARKNGKPLSPEVLQRLAARHEMQQEMEHENKMKSMRDDPMAWAAEMLDQGEVKLQPYQERMAKLFEDKTSKITLKQKRTNLRAQLLLYAKMRATPDCGLCKGGGIIQQQIIGDAPAEEWCKCCLENPVTPEG